MKNLRIINGCEVLIENSIMRLTVRHPDSFFLHKLLLTIAFRLEYVLFYQVYAKITTIFDQEIFNLAPLLYADIERFGGNRRKNDIKKSKMMSKRENRHADIMHIKASYTPSCKTWFFLPRSCSQKFRLIFQEYSPVDSSNIVKAQYTSTFFKKKVKHLQTIVCLVWLNVAFNNFSVISQQCLTDI